MSVRSFASPVFACLLAAAAVGPAGAQQGDGSIYEPLIDRDSKGFKEKKYEKDLNFCRNRAAPQEGAARAGAAEANAGSQQAAAGAALSAAAGVVPGLGWAGANVASAAGSAIGAAGATASAQGAASAGMAANDYRLVIDRCLERRGYVLLR